ncbi:hypothetical protein [Salinibacillus xinjiangensis]|uniref:Uncharacterized protein n=1 Tax=Salinibacillus xinjiangensis TaxID=1229268 RepID=A0A6G1X9G5_9BACI|nr:hypothetical protein [Salinibacillus xinjiangensis]MRG87569.1 hypothetical protein [Salinibacillus xinjiangensis]
MSRKKTSKLFQKYKRLRKEAQTELDQLIAEFKEDLGPAVRNEKELLEEVKSHLKAEAKSTTHVGGRSIFLSFAVGTISLVLAATLFNMGYSQNLIDIANSYFNWIEEFSFMGEFGAALLGLLLLLIFMIMLFIPVYCLTYLFDRPMRRFIYKSHYKIESLEKKLSGLKE